MLSPGEPKALEKGCVCPNEINEHGKGTYSVGRANGLTFFLVDKDCPIHGGSKWEEPANQPSQ